MPRILLLQLKRIGDAVLTAPVLGALRAAMPDAEITLALAGGAAELGPLFADADEILTWNGRRPNLRFWKRLLSLRPDVVLDFTANDRSALLAWSTWAPVRAGYEKFADKFLRRHSWNRLSPASVRDLHTIDFHHALPAAAGLDLPPVSDSGHLKIPDGLALPDILPQNYALIHPGTAREEKFWPAERWAGLMDHLHGGHRLPIVLTGGTSDFEQKHIHAILAATHAPVLNLSGSLSLGQLAGIIAKARLAVTVDTGAMHLAAAFGVPQAGLFGPTNPFHWAPRHPLSVILRAGYSSEKEPSRDSRQRGFPMTQLTEKSVLTALDGLGAVVKWN